ncbi:hypothetical protein LVB77_02705 [Lysobacter sp. 5GHs7-4]|uniref:hypothetical protein n=1 Tax=Lysobacter sp. 5GHs7-4 TaxID=2904253 RepID=UPI001E3C39E2|nr:hypothetical protein [Lysobacter sp. 5GHs7-4]UHQ23647.1 hypothetical protein LVB77_02705 [Lysobacter sp. 5GHs7-4]
MRSLAIGTLLLAVPAAAARERASAPPPLPIVAIVEQQKQIRADDIARRGRYGQLPLATRAELMTKQVEILSLVEDKASTAELSRREQVEVFNRLEWIEATVNDTEDERMICRIERTLGSNRMVRTCRTVADERKEKERAGRSLDRRPRQVGGREI